MTTGISTFDQMRQQASGLDSKALLSVINCWAGDPSINPNLLAALLMQANFSTDASENEDIVNALFEAMWCKGRKSQRLLTLLMMLDAYMHEHTFGLLNFVMDVEGTKFENVIQELSGVERVRAALYILHEGIGRVADGKTELCGVRVGSPTYASLASAFLFGDVITFPIEDILSDRKDIVLYVMLEQGFDSVRDGRGALSLQDLSDATQHIFGLVPPNPSLLHEWRDRLDIPVYLKNRLLNQRLTTWQELLSKTEKELRRGNLEYSDARSRCGLGKRGIEILSAALAKCGYRIGQFAKQ